MISSKKWVCGLLSVAILLPQWPSVAVGQEMTKAPPALDPGMDAPADEAPDESITIPKDIQFPQLWPINPNPSIVKCWSIGVNERCGSSRPRATPDEKLSPYDAVVSACGVKPNGEVPESVEQDGGEEAGVSRQGCRWGSGMEGLK